VWNLARHSALYDSQEQFVDTPTREKGPFLGDSFDVSQATMAAFGERALTRQALRDFARSQARYWPDGRVNVVYPNGDDKRDIPDATQTFVEWIWQAYMTTGDREQLASLYPVARRIADYVARAIDDKTGLVTNLPGGGADYLYGAVDWPPAMRYGYDMQTAARTMMNVLAVVDFRRVAAMAEALGRPDAERAREQARADGVVEAIHERLTRPDGVLVDGLETNGKPSTHASQQANAWALAFGIVPPAQTNAVADYIVSLGNAMGVVYFRVLLDALHAAGRDDALVTSLTDPNRPGYAQILKDGATFTWESWNARAVGDSESHGWGATVLAVLQDHILGVHTTAPGSSRVDVRVPKGSLTRASGTVITQRGPLPVSWARARAGGETLDVVVPANVTASVHLAAGRVADISDDGRSVTGAPGVTAARAIGGEVELTLGSGHYRLANAPPTRGSSSSGVGGLLGFGAGALALVAAVVLALTVVRRRRAGRV
jgi:alpha-L-rhamnosidase